MNAYESLACFLLGYFLRWLSQPRPATVPTVRVLVSKYPTGLESVDGTRIDTRLDDGTVAHAAKLPTPTADATVPS